ncbi:glycoside hydrolase family 92 protein [Sphingobacterium sp. SGG-5]|uniref:GH92 family glycosyl hydrolase n=1 Tax=Sphingobacterium sp. SGG-5 TaxID=2710881 RepID=UPI0013EA3BFD|nr:GH92 family glycosyl hydrolase [Sphingobacterium sp. SGG-5]NGM60999.1 glycoside hydrolase family 92 protein [Sphingobacterium sp. SGG-5]
MKRQKFCVFVTMLLLLASCLKPQSRSLTQYVDPFIGTGGHGHVFLGANVPFGMVQLGPTQMTHGWDWCSGYHYSDSTIVGFGHMHLSGTGIGDLGDISLMPVMGDVQLAKGSLSEQKSGIYSLFSHKRETAKPGYYTVHLDRFGIDVELTATKRVGFHAYTFPKSTETPAVVIDLERGIGWDKPTAALIQQENDTTVSGYRYSTGWAKDQRIYFTAVFSRPIKKLSVLDTIRISESQQEEMHSVFGKVDFDKDMPEPLLVKVALSAVSVDNAKLNLQQELLHWDFKKTVSEADDAWNEQLGKITIETPDIADKRVFYTALYHTMIAPSVFCDVNGDYRGADAKVYRDTSFTNYTTFSLWDTYRAAHPLMSIIHPEMAEDIGNTMLNIYKQQGKLPVWHLMGNETDCMVGNPGIPVLADLIWKGYKLDEQLAFEAMKNSAMRDERGMNWLKQYGYVPYDKEKTYETVAKGLEYALADWAVAKTAERLGKTEDAAYFDVRAKSYQRYFDRERQFMRGLSAGGTFREPFNPFHSAHMEDDYTEGNAWQYTWLVPHDVHGLIDLFGGEEPFVKKLDSLFVVQGDMSEHASADITGLIGQYAHGNEPSHHVTYLYAFVGQPYKTAEKVRYILSELYHDKAEGLSGNEDVGQMSSWYILSALGFYQVAPAGGVYVFGSPAVDKATIKVANNKTFTVLAHNNNKMNIYIQSAKLNGKPYTKSFIDYQDIVAGGTLEFEMGPNPSPTFGTASEDRP